MASAGSGENLMVKSATLPMNSRMLLAIAVGGTLLTGAALATIAAPSVAAPARSRTAPAASANGMSGGALRLLAERCFNCHAGKAQLSGLRLDSAAALRKGGQRGPAVASREPEKSLLIQAVRQHGELKMPPGEKLSAAEIALLSAWVKAGAPWPAATPTRTVVVPSSHPSPLSSGRVLPKLWAFRPLAMPKLPAVRLKGWVRNPVDVFVLAELERNGLKPSPPADPRTLIRRVTFDLTGLPPTREEVEQFVRECEAERRNGLGSRLRLGLGEGRPSDPNLNPNPNLSSSRSSSRPAPVAPRPLAGGAYECLVERLLASPHYGERLAVKWLDLARYADSDGYHDDTDRSMWPYRDYVINAYNRDLPFDQFTIEQLAGDTLPNATTEQKVASAFNRCGPTSSEGGAIPAEYLAKYAVDRVNTTTSVWLGLTFGCTECHDHKYDPFTTKEYYQLFAFFNQVPEEALYRGADAPPVLFYPSAAQKVKLAELDQQIAQLELDAKPREGTADAKAEAARAAEVKKKLDAVKRERAETEKSSKVRIMADVPQRRPTHVLVRGDYSKPGDEVQPGVPAVLGKLPEGAGAPRLALAKWLVDPSNPLTPRVAVNRYWEMLFGRGLARSSDDFGTRGEPPTHPELLDYLASAFATGSAKGGGVRVGVEVGVRSNGAANPTLTRNLTPTPSAASPQGLGWSTKALLKLIVTSATYQQSSRLTPALLARDPDNRLLARGPRFRLPAEMVRDNALAISGLLDRERVVGGPSVKPYQPGDLWRELSAGDQEAKSYHQDRGPDLYRRGLYTFWKRSILYPAFAVFDAPKREVCTVQRPITNTPLQAFVTLNDTAFVEAARVFAQQVMQKGGATPEARLNYAYLRAVARPAAPEERRVLTRIYSQTLAHYRQEREAATKLVSAGEYARPAELDPSELAAWTCVCNALLNLDETLTKE